jgi:hypothetical protein
MFPHVAGEQQVPSARQVCVGVHGAQTIVPPHMFETGWHDGVVTLEHRAGAQQAFALHTSLRTAQVPQLRVPPHPSLIEPQLVAEHVRGVHVAVQSLSTQNGAPTAHVPQFSVPPHVSLMVPHVLFCAAQLDGVQQVPLWHVSLDAQVPHMSVPPQPSL